MGSSKYVRLCSSSPPEVPSSSSMDLDLNRNQVLKGQFEVERPPNKRVGGFMASASTCLSHPTNAAAAAAAASPTRGHYRCDSCGSEFQLDYQLWWHWRDHIPIRDRLLCHLCPFVSTNRESLKQVFYLFLERSEPPPKASHMLPYKILFCFSTKEDVTKPWKVAWLAFCVMEPSLPKTEQICPNMFSEATCTTKDSIWDPVHQVPSYQWRPIILRHPPG